MVFEVTLTDQERDLGAVVNRSMKISTQWATAVKDANSMVVIIRKGMDIRPIYKSMVRLNLKYCVQFWMLHLNKILELEKI